MKIKFYQKVFAAIIFSVSFFQMGFSQQIDSAEAIKMVLKNSSFLNLSTADIENSIIRNAYLDKTSNIQLIYLQQSYQDVPVYNSIQVIALKNNVAISGSGQRIYKMSEKTTMAKAIPGIAAREAVAAAAQSVNIPNAEIDGSSFRVLKVSANNQKIEFQPSDISKENVTAELYWMPEENGTVSLAWQVKLLPKNSPDQWLIMVNAKNASILKKDNLTVSCNWDIPVLENSMANENVALHGITNSKRPEESLSFLSSGGYRVVPYPYESMNHPGGSMVVVNDPWMNAGAGNPVTPLGWHNDGTTEHTITRGNNVWAMEDTDGTDATIGESATSTTALPNLSFNFNFDVTQQPGTVENKKAAITQLFYWNNIMHDITYQYGFDELAGNFQNNNQGRGGAGNDYVIADAQDGKSLNNANFATGADGVRPRMQMYLWRASPYKMVKINPPSPISGTITALEGAVSNANLLADIGAVTGNVVLYIDDAATTSNGCVVPGNAAAVAGKIALIYRGGVCDFATKIKNAQNAGAIAVMIVNNVDDQIIVMAGSDNTITIPAIMIFKSQGDFLKDILAQNATLNFTLSAVKLDGDFDNGIMAHEYAHGISNRLTGGPALPSCLQNKEQMGEGWSDYFALMTTTNWATALVSDGDKKRSIGTYAAGAFSAITSNGIRNYSYSTDMAINPWTYAMLTDIEDGEPHELGEIWTAALWDMTWNIIQMDGINPNLYNANNTGGNSAAMKLVTLGMKLQPCSPGFLDGRDALLKADEILYNGAHSCAIWSAFARRGMGVNAQQGSSNSTTDQVAGFNVPSGAVLKKTVDKSQAAESEILTYNFKLNTQCAAISNYKIVDTLAANVTYIIGSGGSYNATDRVVTFDVASMSSAQVQNFSFKVKVNNGTYFASSVVFSETVPANSVPVSLQITPATGLTWIPTGVNHSVSYALKSSPTNVATEQILSSTASYLIAGHSELRFWQQYNTEAAHDGGVVELSKDNGVSWFDAGPYISLNNYNSTMNSNTNLTNKKAYSGGSNGFIQTVVNLSSFEGKLLKFRFRFVTDNSVSGGQGWYIDDISINKNAAVYNLAWVYDNSSALKSISDTVTAISQGTLPLSWGSFFAEKAGRSSLLKWTTLQEVNVDKFYIERSNDGVHFNSISVLKAVGNSDNVSSYSFTDSDPLNGINFYRIRQVDQNGRFTYTDIRSLEFHQIKQFISLSPNPAKSDVLLKIPGNKDVLNVKLLNAAGQVLKSFTVNEDSYQLSVSTLAAGVYYLKISGDAISTIEKLIIEK